MTGKETKAAPDVGNGESAAPQPEAEENEPVEAEAQAADADTEVEPEAEPEVPPAIDPKDLRIRLLADQLAASDARLKEYIKAHKKAQTEFDAMKVRLRRDQEERVAQARVSVLEALVPVADNLERSLEAAKGGGSDSSFREGVELVHRQFYQALETVGLERFDPVGQAFDPSSMEALGVVPVTDPAQANTVVATLKAGYRAGEIELRPALVQVGRLV